MRTDEQMARLLARQEKRRKRAAELNRRLNKAIRKARMRLAARSPYVTPTDPTIAERNWMLAHGTHYVPKKLHHANRKRRPMRPKDEVMEELDRFFREACDMVEYVKTRPSELLDAYRVWSATPVGSKTFYQHVRLRFKSVAINGFRFLKGVAPAG